MKRTKVTRSRPDLMSGSSSPHKTMGKISKAKNRRNIRPMASGSLGAHSGSYTDCMACGRKFPASHRCYTVRSVVPLLSLSAWNPHQRHRCSFMSFSDVFGALLGGTNLEARRSLSRSASVIAQDSSSPEVKQERICKWKTREWKGKNEWVEESDAQVPHVFLSSRCGGPCRAGKWCKRSIDP